MKEINIKPIGLVKNNEKDPRFGSFANEISEIVVDKEFTDALNGIEDYSHVIIVFWMNKVKGHVITHQPPGKSRGAYCWNFCMPMPPKAKSNCNYNRRTN